MKEKPYGELLQPSRMTVDEYFLVDGTITSNTRRKMKITDGMGEDVHLTIKIGEETAAKYFSDSAMNNIAATYQAEGAEEAKQISNNTQAEIIVMQSEADAQAEEIIAKGEAEYMRILSAAYNDESKAEFYTFVRQLDAVKATLKNGDNTIVLDKDSPIAELFY